MTTHSMLQEIIPFVIFLAIFGVPVIWVLVSGRSRGGAKLGWSILALFLSWIGLAAFLIVTQAPKNRL